MQLPVNGKWTQNPDSDRDGSLKSSFNLDLNTNKKHTRVSPRMIITTDGISNLGTAVGFSRFNGGSGENGFFTVAGDRVFSSNAVDASATFAASSGSATTHSSDTADIKFFGAANKLVTSMQTTFQSNNGSGWTAVSGTNLTSGTPHMMTEYGNRMYCTDDFKKVISLDTSMNTTLSGTYTFTLNSLSSSNVGLAFSQILGAKSAIWLFTINYALGLPARVFLWDGVTDSTPLNSQGYILDSGGVWCAILINDTPYIINTEGRLQYFAGETFVDVENGRLPIDKNKFLKNSFSGVNNRPIHPNGMQLYPDNKIRIFVNNQYEDDTYDEFFQAGIYEFDLKNTALGWYHIETPSLYTSTVTDYGQGRIARVGGLFYAKSNFSTATGVNLIGAQVYTDASSTKYIIATDNTADTIQKYGYLVTGKIYPQPDQYGNVPIESIWQKVFIRHKKLLDGADSITIKHRTEEISPVEATITWTSTNTFTTTTDVSALIGYEVEILQGKGGGKCAHIVSVSGSGTYTVTLDDTFTGASSGTAKARFQNWKKIGTNTKQTVQWFEGMIGYTAPWIQFKVCMQFTGKNEIDDIVVVSNTNKGSN